MKRPYNSELSAAIDITRDDARNDYSSSTNARKLLFPSSPHFQLPFLLGLANESGVKAQGRCVQRLEHSVIASNKWVAGTSKNPSRDSFASRKKCSPAAVNKHATFREPTQVSKMRSRVGDGVGRPLPPAPRLFTLSAQKARCSPKRPLGEIKTVTQKRLRSWSPGLERSYKRVAVGERARSVDKDINVLDAAVALSAMSGPAKQGHDLLPLSALPPPPHLRFCSVTSASS